MSEQKNRVSTVLKILNHVSIVSITKLHICNVVCLGVDLVKRKDVG